MYSRVKSITLLASATPLYNQNYITPTAYKPLNKALNEALLIYIHWIWALALIQAHLTQRVVARFKAQMLRSHPYTWQPQHRPPCILNFLETMSHITKEQLEALRGNPEKTPSTTATNEMTKHRHRITAPNVRNY